MGGQGSRDVLTGARQVTRPLVGEQLQEVRRATSAEERSEAAEQELSPLIELAGGEELVGAKGWMFSVSWLKATYLMDRDTIMHVEFHNVRKPCLEQFCDFLPILWLSSFHIH